MTATLLSLTSLFLSVFVLMLGHGLVGILVPTRLGLEGISANSIGIITAMFAVGLLLGGLFARRLIMRVGHVRVFAASAAMAAISILVCGLWVNEWLWGLMRIVMGFCIASVNTVSDGWLSERATGETRGRILAINQVVVMVAVFLGSFMINLSDVNTLQLYLLAGILFCGGVVPIVMGRVSAPEPEDVPAMSIKKLLKISPVGVMGVVMCGLSYAAWVGLIPLYGKDLGLAGFDISLLVGAVILGGFLLQFPIAYLADRFDRRTVIMLVTVFAGGISFVAPLVVASSFHFGLVLIGLTGGVAACLYPLGIAEAFDRLRTEQMGAAIGTMVVLFAIGGVTGPLVAGFIMDSFNGSALFVFLGIMNLLFAGFVFYRMQVRESLPVEEQEDFVMQGAGGWVSTELDPRTEYSEQTQSLSAEVEAALGIAENKPALAIKMARLVARTSPDQLVDVVQAIAVVEGMNVMQLYHDVSAVVPDQHAEIAQALVAVAPEQATELMNMVLEEAETEDIAEVTVAMTEAAPEQSSEIIQVAAEYVVEEDEPEVVTEIAEAYANSVSDQLDEMRYADRLVDDSEQQVADVVAELAEVVPEQAIDMAAMVVEALPDAASEVVEALKESDAVEGKIMSDITDRPEEG